MINEIKKIVKKDENYVPQNNTTIGGCWTVWGWQYKEVLFTVTDEGYTDGVFVKDKLYVYTTNGNVFFRKGDCETLEEVLENLKKA